MGSTLTAMQAGSTSTVYVVAIEGYKYLLCTGDTAASLTAWSGHDWSLALGGVVVQLDQQQQFHPWQPFQGGGTASIWVQPDVTDQFGIDLFRTHSGATTEITSTITRTTTAINVKRSDDFPAATAEAFIGNECVRYSAKPSTTTMTLDKRGRYSPFMNNNTKTEMAGYHRIGQTENSVSLQPHISQYRRSWLGAWVGIWEHRVVNGVLDNRSNAQLVFAGRIEETRSDPDTGWSVVQCSHVLDSIKESTVGTEMWKARVLPGMYIPRGYRFVAREFDGTTGHTSDPLTVVSGSPGTNEIQEGYYTAGGLAVALNQWLEHQRVATNLTGKTRVMSPMTQRAPNNDGTFHTILNTTQTGTDQCTFELDLPNKVAQFLGIIPAETGGWGTYTWFPGWFFGGTDVEWASPYAPFKCMTNLDQLAPPTAGIMVTEEVGTFFDNSSSVPPQWAYVTRNDTGWGFFIFNGTLLLGKKTGTSIAGLMNVGATTSTDSDVNTRYAPGNEYEMPEIAQVIAISSRWDQLVKTLFYSTGTSAYNTPDGWDVLPYGMGLAIPGELLGTLFDSSVNASAQSAGNGTVWFKKPAKLVDMLTSNCILRGQHLIWKNGGLQFVNWSTPSATTAIATLDESNKAEPAGNTGTHRSAMAQTKEWLRSVIKLQYDYDVIVDRFGSTLTLEDQVAIDDAGGTPEPISVDCRNITRADMIALAPDLLARMSTFSRPAHKMTRSIDMRFYEGYAPGDCVLVTDSDARDPATGTRGITDRPGIIVRHRYNPGGPQPGNPANVTPPSGEVDLFYLSNNRTAAYAPTAKVDETHTTGTFTNGYSNSTRELYTKSHEHSETTGAIDATRFFPGDLIRVLEIDPSVAASPTTWNREVESVVGNVIKLTVALSAPSFDTALTYRIVSQSYTSAVAEQQAQAYEADHVDGMIQNTEEPYQYGLPPNGTDFTSETHTKLAELYSTSSTGDGVCRDVGAEVGAYRTINNLMDHKTAHQSPGLVGGAVSGSKTNYQLMFIRPIYFGTQQFGQASRSIWVAPFFKSASGTVTVRITLLASRPTDTTIEDVTRPTPYSEASWSTSSASHITGAEAELSLSVVPTDGWAWLIVEGSNSAVVYGVAQCIERERV